jgi:hypothetical protein
LIFRYFFASDGHAARPFEFCDARFSPPLSYAAITPSYFHCIFSRRRQFRRLAPQPPLFDFASAFIGSIIAIISFFHFRHYFRLSPLIFFDFLRAAASFQISSLMLFIEPPPLIFITLHMMPPPQLPFRFRVSPPFRFHLFSTLFYFIYIRQMLSAIIDITPLIIYYLID